MVKRILTIAVLGLAGTFSAASSADAGIFFRPVAPVRRVVARTVLPPYPVARRVIPGPVYGPYIGPVYGYGPAFYGTPYVYGGGVSVVVGY
jgi:hypothetical protein